MKGRKHGKRGLCQAQRGFALTAVKILTHFWVNIPDFFGFKLKRSTRASRTRFLCFVVVIVRNADGLLCSPRSSKFAKLK